MLPKHLREGWGLTDNGHDSWRFSWQGFKSIDLPSWNNNGITKYLTGNKMANGKVDSQLKIVSGF